MKNYEWYQMNGERKLIYRIDGCRRNENLQFACPYRDEKNVLLPYSTENWNGQMVLVYHLTYCNSLQEMIVQPMNLQELLKLLRWMSDAVQWVKQEGNLAEQVCRNLEYVFIQTENCKVQLVYNPYEQNGRVSWNELFMDALQRAVVVDDTKQVVAFIKQYISFQEHFLPDDFIRLIENLEERLCEKKEYSGNRSLSYKLDKGSIELEEENASRKEILEAKATIIRQRTQEVKPLNKKVFRIGKEKYTVDFCVPDNGAISRVHAEIICDNDKYYIRDLNSTNGTFVEDKQITNIAETELVDGSRVLVANELFCIHIKNSEKKKCEQHIQKRDNTVPF